ncbi:chorismate mutase [Streptomyces sp. NPDC029674]|uniref:chorismate mutase n=1 Tax=Streptomyces sp. NPDC029674 TaxID=3365297 RepID=UPI00385090DC
MVRAAGRGVPRAGLTAPHARIRSAPSCVSPLPAAAKYGTGSPIDDPARERQVLEAVAGQAEEIGADPEATVRVFRDQIEAHGAALSLRALSGLRRLSGLTPATANSTVPTPTVPPSSRPGVQDRRGT